ncbi:hypothetical protein CO663_09775 [Rhizobium anhuiense]|nr:hypothetical protein CO663_09775 [Rhizobium anhuiense]
MAGNSDGRAVAAGPDFDVPSIGLLHVQGKAIQCGTPIWPSLERQTVQSHAKEKMAGPKEYGGGTRMRRGEKRAAHDQAAGRITDILAPPHEKLACKL